MATIASPQPKAHRGRGLLTVIVVFIAIAAMLALAFFGFSGLNAPATGLPAGWRLTEAASGPIDAAIDVAGAVEARASAELRFAQEGTITALLTQVGAAIRAGEPLGRIDDAQLTLRLAQAQADLAQARADYSQAEEGATPEQVAAAQARVTQAQAQYQQASGRISPADIEAARARIAQAQARLDRLQAGPASDDLARSQDVLRRAQSDLAQARTDLAAAKERARLEVEAKANALRNAQDEYSRIYWENRKLEQDFNDLPQAEKDREAQALRTVQDGETALQQDQLAYEQAQQNEITTLEAREAELVSAQAGLERANRGALPEDIASARAELQRARAELAQLQGDNRQGELGALAAGIEAAQADLAKLNADPAASALLKAEAGITRAELAVQQAELALKQATLVAPFDATVVRLAMRVGESAGQGAIIAVADLSSLLVTADVDELDVAQLQIGQNARVTLDALPDAELSGTVTAIAPAATRSANGSNTYRIEITLAAADGAAKPGMTAALRVVVARKDNAVLVPRRAIVNEGGASYVRLPSASVEAAPGEPAYERREVVVGLSNGEFTEVLDGLRPGDQLYIQDAATGSSN